MAKGEGGKALKLIIYNPLGVLERKGNYHRITLDPPYGKAPLYLLQTGVPKGSNMGKEVRPFMEKKKKSDTVYVVRSKEWRIGIPGTTNLRDDDLFR